MQKLLGMGVFVLLFFGCIRESSDPTCDYTILFDMKEVPYTIKNTDTVDYLPYYHFLTQLNLLTFQNDKLYSISEYDYEFCKQHSVIPFNTDIYDNVYLFLANLFDERALSYSVKDGNLDAVLSIIDHQEPPVYLVASGKVNSETESIVPVDLRMLVSRLEVQVDNPLKWMTNMQIGVDRIAGKISGNFVLSDTTYIVKHLEIDPVGGKTNFLAINTFPSYPDKPAIVNFYFTGKGGREFTYNIKDDLFRFLPHTITLIRFGFGGTEEDVTISVSVNGKWEILDEGHIEI